MPRKLGREMNYPFRASHRSRVFHFATPHDWGGWIRTNSGFCKPVDYESTAFVCLDREGSEQSTRTGIRTRIVGLKDRSPGRLAYTGVGRKWLAQVCEAGWLRTPPNRGGEMRMYAS